MKKKKFKGMTLMEIIISLAILAVMTLVLVQTSNAINMYIRSANNVNKNTSEQAPIAEMGHKDGASQVATNVNINISGNGFSDIALRGNAYEVGTHATEIVYDEEGSSSVVEKNEIGGNLNMQFIADVSAPPTSSEAP